MNKSVENGMRAQHLARAEALKIGERQIGWKSAFGTPEAKRKFGLSAPLVGYMTDNNYLPPGATIDVSKWSKPAIEMEIAAIIATDLPSGINDSENVQAAIAGFMPAFEILDAFGPLDDVEKILSANIYHRYIIIDQADQMLSATSPEKMTGRISINGGHPVEIVDTASHSGAPALIVTQVANHLLDFGEYLRKGDIVICGSIVPPIFVETESHFSYELAPYAPLSVSLT